MKKGQLSRADMLTAIVKEDHKSQSVIARALGLTSRNEEILHSELSNKRKEFKKKVLHRGLTASFNSCFWQLMKLENYSDDRKREPIREQKGINEKVVWHYRPESLPDYPAITTLKDIRRRLFSKLHRQYHDRQQIDILALIDKLSLAELVGRLPKKKRPRNLHLLQIIDDRQLHLTPYWLDHVWVTKQLQNEFSRYQISRAVLQNGADCPQLINEHEGLLEYRMPLANVPVLILSDLGRLSNNGSNRVEHFNHRQNQSWRLIRQLLANGNFVFVLTPCHPKDYPLALRQQIQFVTWEDSSTPLTDLLQQSADNRESEDIVATWIEILRTLVSPAIRLEPQVLRSLRLGLRDYGYKIPAFIEALFWQHQDIKEPHNVAATLNPQTNKKYRKAFGEQSPELQAFALRTIKKWRARLPPEIWFEELLNIESMLGPTSIFGAAEAHEFHQDIDDACNFLQQVIDLNKIQRDRDDAYCAWATRLETRISESAVQTGKANRLLQLILSQVSPDDKQSPSGHIIDPDLWEQASLPKQRVWLCQYSNQMAVALRSPTQTPEQNISVIAPVEYRHPRMKVTQIDGVSFFIELPSQRLANNDIIFLKDTENLHLKGMLTFKTDCTKLLLQAIEKPGWAISIGQDVHGLFTDVEIAENKDCEALIQRFRWIAAGDFMMGSPESELERVEWEGYHRVFLSRGYWLADTSVTQAVWQATTGNNPSRVKGEQLPVDQVSLYDAQNFIKKLNETLESSLIDVVVRLPTEAEWEHACRAGTDTIFAFGNKITPDQVNYKDELSCVDEKKDSFKIPVAVKSFPANLWGLYEMHGNVWEWCADGWQEHQGESRSIDPYHKFKSLGVIRGGSCNERDSIVRSAYRHHSAPLHRNAYHGIRLLIGHQIDQEESTPLSIKTEWPEVDNKKMVGSSRALSELRDMIFQVAKSDATILITGESGTGKELVANLLRESSNRNNKPFLKINCNTISDSLLESDLFGHEKGSFTGADSKRIGKFEVVDGGTIFLDEIGDISPRMQAALLRVLQDGEIIRVGGNMPIKIDVRVISATNRDLGLRVREGTFRLDLFYRLNIINISIPPLRERKEDLIDLTTHFIRKYRNAFKKEINYLPQSIIERLLEYDWPGNVRELENVIQRAILMAKNNVITEHDLFFDVKRL